MYWLSFEFDRDVSGRRIAPSLFMIPPIIAQEWTVVQDINFRVVLISVVSSSSSGSYSSKLYIRVCLFFVCLFCALFFP